MEREHIEYDLGCTSNEMLSEKEYNFYIFDDLMLALNYGDLRMNIPDN